MNRKVFFKTLAALAATLGLVRKPAALAHTSSPVPASVVSTEIDVIKMYYIGNAYVFGGIHGDCWKCISHLVPGYARVGWQLPMAFHKTDKDWEHFHYALRVLNDPSFKGYTYFLSDGRTMSLDFKKGRR